MTEDPPAEGAGTDPLAVAYVGVGSNIEPEANVPRALTDLARRYRVVGVSTFYRTPAIGAPGASDFYNGVVSIEVRIRPAEIRRVLYEVETDTGRVRSRDQFADRVIDLDLLWVEGAREPDRVRLHDDVRTRSFVALPLLELAPDLVLPGGTPLADLADRLGGPLGAELTGFTERLRASLLGTRAGHARGADPD